MLLFLPAFMIFPALAQEGDMDEEDEDTGTEPAPEPTAEPAPPMPTPEAAPPMPTSEITVKEKKRTFVMETGVRGRYLTMPPTILDIWYYRHEGEAFERPSVSAYTIGAEWAIKGPDGDNGIFYVEFVRTMIDEGYWDDVEDPADYTDGNYVVPVKFGIVALGANYGKSFDANKWFSFIFGTGIGVGIKLGHLEAWDPGESDESGDNVDPTCLPDSAAYERKDECVSDGDIAVPPAIPMLDVNIGFRFNFSDRAYLRLEGGFHYLLYGGLAFGIVY